MKRVRAPDPFFDDGVRGWIFNYSRKHFWRVAHWMDFDDLVQEGIMYFFVIRRHYPLMTEKRQLMAYFKVVWASKITDMANHRTKHPELHLASLKPGKTEDETLELIGGVEDAEVAFFCASLGQAPKPVQAVLHIFAVGSTGLRSPLRVGANGKETMNERWCRLTGYDPKEVDLPLMVRDYLTGKEPPCSPSLAVSKSMPLTASPTTPALAATFMAIAT